MESGRNGKKKPPGRLWFGAGAVSAGLHICLLAALVLSGRGPAAPPVVTPTPIVVTLFRPPPPAPPPSVEPADEAPAAGGSPEAAPAAAPEPAPEPPRPAPRPVRAPTPPPPRIETLAVPPAAPAAAPAPVWTTVGEGRLAGAARAGSGGGGSGGGAGAGAGSGGGGDGAGCDMIGRIQQALRADPEVRAAVAEASAAARGRALLVWDGDWVQTPGQAGKGLAGLRQAIALEVAFAPEPCRRQPMRGLALITFAGGERVAFGTADWRWSQMLGR